MTKITNTARGARGVRTDQGLVMVEPGQTVDVELADNEELYEGLVKGGGKKAEADSGEPKPLAKMNKTELLETAKAENAKVADDATNAQLVEAIEKARAAK